MSTTFSECTRASEYFCLSLIQFHYIIPYAMNAFYIQECVMMCRHYFLLVTLCVFFKKHNKDTKLEIYNPFVWGAYWTT